MLQRRGDQIENPLSGQRVTLILPPAETQGRSFVLEGEMAPGVDAEGIPPHLHPATTETFEILRGRGRYQLGRQQADLQAGDTVVMPAGIGHLHPWNVGDEPLIYRQTAVSDPPDPAGAQAALTGLSTLFALAREGRTNRAGMANPLQMAVIARSMMPGTFLAAAPIGLQRLLLPPLAALGRLCGYRVTYPRHRSV